MKKNVFFDPVKFGRIIKNLRREHNLVQDEISGYLGVTRSAFSGIEIGKHGPSINTFLGIYHFFKEKGIPLTTDYLFGLMEKFGRAVDQEVIRLRKENETLVHENDLITQQVDQLKKIVKLLESGK